MFSKITRRLDAHIEPTDVKVLEVGDGKLSQRNKYFSNLTTLDINPKRDPHILADAHKMPIADETYDMVYMGALLEHVKYPHQVISECYRVLKKGGKLMIGVPFCFPLHDMPHDYWRFTSSGIRVLLKDFDIQEITTDNNTIVTLAIIFQRIGFQCDTLWWRPFKLFWFLLAEFTLLFKNILTKQYGDMGHKTEVDTILPSGFGAVAIKPLIKK
ncbi:class I SAM-dependent methyltransferase [Patescibacteria group bacterium]|nr:class I SAM-dependent methyltransferase [Patescibacteria group bacterium]MBU1910812.1 class I SAM-dependent methyltransferase [Patescibacteria group bacterium]